MQATASGDTARADAVVTFTAPRPAHVFAGLTAGPTLIAPIGSPPEAIVSQLGLHLSTPFDFAPLLAPRARDANKGSYGHVLVIGGSVGKAGAAAMAGLRRCGRVRDFDCGDAKVRAGCGGVVSSGSDDRGISGNRSGHDFIAGGRNEPRHAAGSYDHRDRAGISRNSETAAFVRTIVTRGDKSLVVDADGLNAFEGTASKLNGRGRSVVITPTQERWRD